jgi:hypothetical protein
MAVSTGLSGWNRLMVLLRWTGFLRHGRLDGSNQNEEKSENRDEQQSATSVHEENLLRKTA